jgi:hypothetical protein
MAQRSIVQITPAGTWRAQFKTTQPGTSGLPNLHLACWALIETETSGIPTREIAGMIVSPPTDHSPSKLMFADELQGFVGYVP